MFYSPQPRLYQSSPYQYSSYEPSVSTSSAEYYRHLAEEHQRRAQLALARAQEEQELAAEVERRRIAALLREERERERELALHLPPRYTEESFDPYSFLSSSPYQHRPSRNYSGPLNFDRHLPEDEDLLNYVHALRIEEELAQKEAAAARERQEKEAKDRALVELLRTLGIAPSNLKSEEEQRAPETKCSCNHHARPNPTTSQFVSHGARSPISEGQSRDSVPNEHFVANLWKALAEGRSNDEKASILESLGIPLPRRAATHQKQANAALSNNSQQSTRTSPQETTSQSIPVVVRISTPTSEKQNSPTPLPSQPAQAQEPTLQHRRTSSIDSITGIQAKFDSLKALFQLPSHLEFSAEASSPVLLYNSNNAPFNKYENELTKLLTKLDEVESHGDALIREKRKSLVMAIEAELGELDRKKMEEWKSTQLAQTSVQSNDDATELSDSTQRQELPEAVTEVDASDGGDCAIADSDEELDADEGPVNQEVSLHASIPPSSITTNSPSSFSSVSEDISTGPELPIQSSTSSSDLDVTSDVTTDIEEHLLQVENEALPPAPQVDDAALGDNWSDAFSDSEVKDILAATS